MMIELVIVEIKIPEISMHANKQAVPAFASFEDAGVDANAASIIDSKPPPRLLQLYNSAAAAAAKYNRSLNDRSNNFSSLPNPISSK
jgi:hypothetical protein